MRISLFGGTPSVIVLNNRGLTVRDIAYCRHPDAPNVTEERITRHHYGVRGFLTKSVDPRLYNTGRANFMHIADMAGRAIRSQGVDNGTTLSLNDAIGRPSISVSHIRTASDGTDDRSQAVTRAWQFEDAGGPDRPVSMTEQVAGEAAHVTKRFVYAGGSDTEKALNLAGASVGRYDPAGLMQTNSVALTGVPLSVTRHLLQDADNTDTVADWQGDDVSAWNDLLDGEAFITLTTADATGAVLTTTDARINLQRVAYNAAGMLSGSWLTVKGGAEHVIVKSLTYSAAGQKLREEHGNGVVTTYTYEPKTQLLTGIKTERPAGHVSGPKVLQDLRYGYDPVGNVLKITNDAEETRFWRTQKVVPENIYAYDSLYQLVNATGREMANAGKHGSHLTSASIPLPIDSSAYTTYTRTYIYDSASNLTQVRHSPAAGSGYTTRITVSDRSNRGILSTLTENAADVDELFTAGGQQKLLQPGQNLVWTSHNELLKVTPVVRDGGTDDWESYRYDGGSQRVLKVSVQKTGTSTQTQRVLYLPGLELRSTKAGNTETEGLQVITMGEAGRAQVRVLHWDSGKPAEISNNQLRWSYDNQIGSSNLELDEDSNLISMEEYYPYGGTAVWTARSMVEADYKAIRYSGKERDATGLYYYGYRYYQPWVGRWLSADPAGTVDGLNLFRMVRNSPVTLKDDDGLMPTPSTNDKTEPQALGGKVYDVIDYKNITLDKVSDSEFLKKRIRENLGAIDILGYHVTGEENLPSLLENGFLSNYREGTSGGVAGKNIRGPGLYLSKKINNNDYAHPDKKSVVLAVIKLANIELLASSEKYSPWEEDNYRKAINDPGDFIKTGDEIKINPNSIKKIGLVPIHVIQRKRDMQPEAVKRTWDNRQTSTRLPTGFIEWINEKMISNDKELEEIEAIKDDDEKGKRIYFFGRSLKQQNPPEGTAVGHITAHLKEKLGYEIVGLKRKRLE